MKIPKGFKVSAFPPLAEMVEKAAKVDACEDSLDILRKYDSVMQILLHEPKHMIAGFAHWYALRVLHARWPEAEPVILQDAECSCVYARYVLRTRWPEAEAVILQDACWSYWYARYVLHARWPEAEPVILNSRYAEDYRESVFRHTGERIP